MNLTYRTEEEIEHWRGRDPLALASQGAMQAGASRIDLDAIDSQVNARLKAALLGAQAGPVPAPESALDYSYASPTPVRWGLV